MRHESNQTRLKPHIHVGFTNVPPAGSHLPLRANSIDLMAVVLLVPVVTLNEATSSWVSVFNTKICNNKQNMTESSVLILNIKINQQFLNYGSINSVKAI